MACDHVGAPDVIHMTEAWLREQRVPVERWPGTRGHYAENTPDGMWESVVIEIERRGDQWVVTRLDRNRERVDDTGLKISTA